MSETNEWDVYADGWDDNEDVRCYAALAFAGLSDYVSLEGARVLDFGCGTGLLTEKLSPVAASVVAIDPSTKMIETLRQKELPNVDMINGYLGPELIELEPSLQVPFDLIVASSVCAFVPDFPQTLELLKQLLAPGAAFVQWDWMASEDEPDFGFSAQVLKEAYERALMEVVFVGEGFVMESQKKSAPVVMGVARLPA